MPQSWFSITNIDDASAEVNIYDEIGFFGITAKDFLDQLKAVGSRKITLRINSPGGSVFDGTAIYNRLKDHAPGVEVKIDGLAASIASVIAMAGSKITMAENALLMIHNASGLVMGNADDMRQLADTLDKIDGTIAATYARRSGKTPEEMQALMDAETWFTAAEAKDANLIDAIAEPVQIAAKFSGTVQNNFKRQPGAAPTPSEAELAFAAALDRVQSLEGQCVEFQAKISEQAGTITALETDLAGARAKIVEFEAKEARLNDHVRLLKAARNLAPAAVVPVTSPEGEGEDDAALYDRFKAASPAEATRMFNDPALAPRLRAESARRHPKPAQV